MAAVMIGAGPHLESFCNTSLPVWGSLLPWA